VCILDDSFTTKLSYPVFLNYLISFLIRNFSNLVCEGIDVSVNSELSHTDDS
jgi:hypothetical protein